jgi:hypothetical protein
MYGKVFQSMYDGTLATKGPWQALVTFQQMIVLADKDGVVDKTAGAISRITSIPLEIIEIGLEELCKPDPDSRSEADEGRRIVLLEPHRNWGWQIVNYVKYAAIRSSEERREYMRAAQARHRAKKMSITNVDSVDCLSMSILSTHVPVDVPIDIEENTRKKTRATPTVSSCPEDVDKQVWDDWVALRKSKRAAVTATALKGIRREARNAGITLQKALEIGCERGWVGFDAKWLLPTGKPEVSVTVGDSKDADRTAAYLKAEQEHRKSIKRVA